MVVGRSPAWWPGASCAGWAGDKLAAGERFGMIRFGSRTDCYVPRGTDVAVRVGEPGRGRRDRARDAARDPAAAIRAPRRRRWQELRERRRQGIFLLPSLLTTGNLFCGFFALVLTVEAATPRRRWRSSSAMVMDLLDGRWPG